MYRTKRDEQGRSKKAHGKKTQDKKTLDDQEPKSYSHGIKDWTCFPAEEISDILNALFKSPPLPEAVGGLYFHPRQKYVECCPNCGHAVKSLRRMHLKLCRKSALFRKMKLKTPSAHICGRCGLDLRRVKIK